MNNTIIKLLSTIIRPRVSHAEIINILKPEEIKSLLTNLILIEDTDSLPKQCEHCDSPAKLEESGEKLIIQCMENPGHLTEKNLSQYRIYIVDVAKAMNNLISSYLSFTVASTADNSIRDTYKLNYTHKGEVLEIIFMISDEIMEEVLYKIISKSVMVKRPIILITKNNDANKETVENLLVMLPLGNLIYPLYLDDLQNKKVCNELKSWVNNYIQLKSMEEGIIHHHITK